MTEVWVGIKECGCLVAISFERDWLDKDYNIHRMDLEEARDKLKVCKCAVPTGSTEKEKEK